ISTERSSQSSDCTISLQPSRPSPQLVGERIVWTAAATGCGTTPVFQFGVKADDTAEPGEAAGLGVPATNRGFRMVRGFSPDNTFAWAPLQEGSYEIIVRIKNGFDAQDFSFAVVSDAVNPRATSADAVVTPTLNPLVALYSAPPCNQGSIVVAFKPASDDGPWVRTNPLPCVIGASRNFVVGGMLPSTTDELVHIADDAPSSPPLFFTTGTPPTTLNIPPV